MAVDLLSEDFLADLRDIPYVDGGRDRDGLDCIGCYRLAYEKATGRLIPSYLEKHVPVGEWEEIAAVLSRELGRSPWQRVSKPEPGDLVAFWIRKRELPVHVGMVLGDGYMIHVRQPWPERDPLGRKRQNFTQVESYEAEQWKCRIHGFFRYQPGALIVAPGAELADQAKVRVLCVPAPFLLSTFDEEYLEPGMSIADMIRHFDLREPDDGSIRVLGLGFGAIPACYFPERHEGRCRCAWRLIRPRAGTTILLRPVSRATVVLSSIVLGFIGASIGSAIGAAVGGRTGALVGGLIGGVAFGGLSGLLTGATTGSIVAGIVAGTVYGAFLGLTYPQPPKGSELSGPNESQAGSAETNELRPWAPIPVCYGTVNVFPPYAARPFTVVNGDRRDATGVLMLGHGRHKVHEIRVNGVPAEEIEGAEFELVEGGTVEDYQTEVLAPLDADPGDLAPDPDPVHFWRLDGSVADEVAGGPNLLFFNIGYTDGHLLHDAAQSVQLNGTDSRLFKDQGPFTSNHESGLMGDLCIHFWFAPGAIVLAEDEAQYFWCNGEIGDGGNGIALGIQRKRMLAPFFRSRIYYFQTLFFLDVPHPDAPAWDGGATGVERIYFVDPGYGTLADPGTRRDYRDGSVVQLKGRHVSLSWRTGRNLVSEDYFSDNRYLGPILVVDGRRLQPRMLRMDSPPLGTPAALLSGEVQFRQADSPSLTQPGVVQPPPANLVTGNVLGNAEAPLEPQGDAYIAAARAPGGALSGYFGPATISNFVVVEQALPAHSSRRIWDIGTNPLPPVETSRGARLRLFSDQVYPHSVQSQWQSKSGLGLADFNERWSEYVYIRLDRASEVQADFECLAGLYIAKSNGSITEQTVYIDMDYKLESETDWHPIKYAEGVTFGNIARDLIEPGVFLADQQATGFIMRASIREPFFFNARWRLPETSDGPWLVRVRYNTLVTSDTHPSVVDAVLLHEVRGVLYDAPIVLEPGLSLLAYRIPIRNNGPIEVKMQRAIRKWNVATQRLVEVYDDNAAWACLDILRGAANARPIPDAEINFKEFTEWASRAVNVGIYVDYLVSAFDVFNQIAQVGLAALDYVDGKWTIAEDRPGKVATGTIAAENSQFIRGERRYLTPETFHAYRVRYNDLANRGAQAEVIVPRTGFNIDGSGGYTKAEQFELLDLTNLVNDREVAVKLARYKALTRERRLSAWEVRCFLDGWPQRRLGRVPFSHFASLIGRRSGRVVDYDSGSQTVTGSQPLVFEPGKSYQIQWRIDTYTTAIYNLVNPAGGSNVETRLFELVDPPTPEPQDGWLYAVGEANKVAEDAMVMGITFGPDRTIRFQLTEYAEAVHTEIGQMPPPWDPPVRGEEPVVGIPAPPQVPKITRVVTDESTMRRIDGGLYSFARVMVKALPGYGEPPQGFDVRYRYVRPKGEVDLNDPFADPRDTQLRLKGKDWSYADRIPAEGRSGLVGPLVEGALYHFEASAIGFSTRSPFGNLRGHIVRATATPPPAVTNLRAEGYYARWDYEEPPIDFLGFAVRFAPNMNAITEGAWSRGFDVIGGNGITTKQEIPLLHFYSGGRSNVLVMVRAMDAGRNLGPVATMLIDLKRHRVAVWERSHAADKWPGTITNGSKVLLSPDHSGVVDAMIVSGPYLQLKPRMVDNSAAFPEPNGLVGKVVRFSGMGVTAKRKIVSNSATELILRRGFPFNAVPPAGSDYEIGDPGTDVIEADFVSGSGEDPFMEDGEGPFFDPDPDADVFAGRSKRLDYAFTVVPENVPRDLLWLEVEHEPQHVSALIYYRPMNEGSWPPDNSEDLFFPDDDDDDAFPPTPPFQPLRGVLGADREPYDMKVVIPEVRVQQSRLIDVVTKFTAETIQDAQEDLIVGTMGRLRVYPSEGKRFAVPPVVGVIIQGGSDAVRYEIVEKSLSPVIQFYDANGDPAGAVVDVVLTGPGEER